MELTVFNPQKGRLETISADLTTDNTTRFENFARPDDVATITDLDGALLIASHSRNYPIIIYNASRSLVGYDQAKAGELQRQALS